MLFSVLWLALSAPAWAAEGEQLEIWSEVGVSADLPKHLELSVSEQLRVTPGQGVFAEELLSDVALSWADWKDLELSLGYRYAFLELGGEDAGRSQRLHFDLGYDWKLKPVKLYARVRYQQRPPWIEEAPKHTARLKVGVRARTDWELAPYASVEPWKRISDPGLQKVRGEVGVRTKQKHWGAKVFYRVEQPISDPTDPRNHIIGLNFTGAVDLD